MGWEIIKNRARDSGGRLSYDGPYILIHKSTGTITGKAMFKVGTDVGGRLVFARNNGSLAVGLSEEGLKITRAKGKTKLGNFSVTRLLQDGVAKGKYKLTDTELTINGIKFFLLAKME